MCWKDSIYAMFLKSRGYTYIKYDILTTHLVFPFAPFVKFVTLTPFTCFAPHSIPFIHYQSCSSHFSRDHFPFTSKGPKTHMDLFHSDFIFLSGIFNIFPPPPLNCTTCTCTARMVFLHWKRHWTLIHFFLLLFLQFCIPCYLATISQLRELGAVVIFVQKTRTSRGVGRLFSSLEALAKNKNLNI